MVIFKAFKGPSPIPRRFFSGLGPELVSKAFKGPNGPLFILAIKGPHFSKKHTKKRGESPLWLELHVGDED